MKETNAKYKSPVCADYEISLEKFQGKKIVDVVGYISGEFGTDTLVFKVNRVVFEDGASVWLEGEHDIAYIPNEGNDNKRLSALYEETNE
jgi:hypothetical protein